jgi:tetratricopeptide (TPR) repeat protein
MSRTLNLVDRLLAMGRRYQQLGCNLEARQAFGRLADFRELPAAAAEETQFRLAELHLKARRFRRARRHLTAALGHRPDNARYHYLLANALDNDTPADPPRAAAHYRRSLQLEPNQPRCLAEFGLLCLAQGQPEEGLDALKRAAALAPDDPAVVGCLVEGLRQEGFVEEARRALRAALFRNPRDARFRRLRDDFEYHQLRRRQEAQAHGLAGQDAEGGPVLLPFVRPPSAQRPGRRKVFRRDGAAPAAAPHLPRPGRVPGHKKAQ